MTDRPPASAPSVTTPADNRPSGSDGAGPSPEMTIRSPAYRKLLVLSAGIGLFVSFASWAFLELTHALQVLAFETGPALLGFSTPPWWWLVALLALAGLLVGFAIERLPGDGGHEPLDGLAGGPPTPPSALPGVLLAALASIGLGFVLGPEGPLLALAAGLAVFAIDRSRRELPEPAVAVLAAAASFAAISTIFGSPIVGAIVIVEAAGLGGERLRLVLLPGLLAAGIGSIVFIGMGSLTGLSSAAFAIQPLALPTFVELRVTDFLWTIGLAIVAAAATFAIRRIGHATQRVVAGRRLLLTPLAGIAVALLAIGFARLTGEPATLVLLSGQEAMDGIVDQAATMSMLTLGLLLLCKGLAWGVSLGSARGGPTFPALFLGIVAGTVAGQLPGFAETPAVAALMAAMCVSILRLPLSSVLIAVLVSEAGVSVSPLVIVAVVVALIASEALDSGFGLASDEG